MLRAKEGEFFTADWLRNRNTVEFLGICERVHNPDFSCGEFTTIRSKAGLNAYRISVKDWVEKTGAIGLRATTGRRPKAPHTARAEKAQIQFVYASEADLLNVALFGKRAAE